MVAAAFSKSCRKNEEDMDMSNVQTIETFFQNCNNILDISMITGTVLFLVRKLFQRKQCRNRSQEET